MLGISERLQILRSVYGMSESVKLSSNQIRNLWKLCTLPEDREELMAFIASASTYSGVNFQSYHHPSQEDNNDGLTVALRDDVRKAAFLDLFCSEEMNWE